MVKVLLNKGIGLTLSSYTLILVLNKYVMIDKLKSLLTNLNPDVKSRTWLVWILLLLLLANNVHLYEVYSSITGHSGLHVVLILVVLDLSVLTFAAHGKRFSAFLFSAVVFAATISYFFHGPMIKDDPFNNWGFSIIGVLLSLIYACAVYQFTEIFVKKDDDEKLEKRDAIIRERKAKENSIKEVEVKVASEKEKRSLKIELRKVKKDISEREEKLKYTAVSKRAPYQVLIDDQKKVRDSLIDKIESL
jgi:hypothetical protein